MAQQQRRELASSIQTTRAGDAEIPANEITAEFASVHASFHSHFVMGRHLIDRQTFNGHRSAALAEWQSLAS